jgi:hypothetical protein
MAIDFSTLDDITEEELEAIEKRRLAKEIREDHDKRLSYCKHGIRIILTEDAEISLTTTGSRLAILRGTDSNRRPVRAIYYTPDHLWLGDADTIVRPMLEDVTLDLKGYWAREKYGDRPFTFKAQFVEIAPTSGQEEFPG